MIIFWIAAALLSAAAVALIVHFSGREPQVSGADPAAVVYRRQLDEIDELAARGLIPEDERRAAHAEAARRLLGATAEAPEAAPSRKTRMAVVAAAVAASLAAMGLYLFIGAPGAPDQPFKRRAAQWAQAAKTDASQLDPERIAVILKDVVAERPNEPEPLFFLARAQVESGQVQLGIHNLKKVTAMAPDNAEVWTTLGEALTLATRKEEVTPEAQAAFRRALQLDPNQVRAAYFLGRAKIANGDLQGGLADWREVLAKLGDDPNAAGLREEIAQVEKNGTLEAPTPDAAAGPTAPMIQQMVEGLAARLKDNLDDVDGWARLIRSYQVLGDVQKRDQAIAEARRIFKDRPSDLARINGATEVAQ